MTWTVKALAKTATGCFECVVPLRDGQLFAQRSVSEGPVVCDARGALRPIGGGGGYSCAASDDALYTLSCERVDSLRGAAPENKKRESTVCTALTRFERKEQWTFASGLPVLAQVNAQGGYRWGGLRLSPSQKRVAVFFDDGALSLYDERLTLLARRKLKPYIGETIGAIGWVGDDLVVGKDDRLMLVSGDTLRTLRAVQRATVTGIAADAGATLIATASPVGVELYDVSLARIAIIPTFADRVWLSPSGRHLMFSRFQRAPRGLWHVELDAQRVGSKLRAPKRVRCAGEGNILYGCFTSDDEFIVGFPRTMDALHWA